MSISVTCSAKEDQMKRLIVCLVMFLAFISLLAQSYEWDWVVSAGGTGSDNSMSIAIDSLGCLYVTGLFSSSISLGSLTLTSNGGTDIFVAKLDNNGNYLWAVSAGGTGNDNANDIAIDTSANVYIAGRFEGTAGFGSLQLTSNGGYDVFVAKLDNSGNYLWAARAGGTGSDAAYGLAVDSAANTCLTGRFENSAAFGFQTLTSSGGDDIFAAKLDEFGSFLWAVQAGGAEVDERGTDIVVDSSDNAYLTGYFYGTAGFGTLQLTSAGLRDIFVAKLNSNGNFLWAVQAGGINDYDWGSGLAVDNADNIYLTGFFDNTANWGSIQLISNGYHDVFAAKLDSSGNYLWVAKAGGIGGDQAWSIAVDAEANVCLTGFFFGTASFGTNSVTSFGYFDVFAAKLDSGGNWLWALSAGSANDQDVGYGIAVDDFANAYLTGCYEGTATFGPVTLTNAGNTDLFVAKLTSNVVVNDETLPQFSNSLSLHDAYPNPFTKGVNLQIKGLDPAVSTQISIHNLKGQLVRRIAVSGKSELNWLWDGTDNFHTTVSPGLYIVKINSGQQQLVTKLLKL